MAATLFQHITARILQQAIKYTAFYTVKHSYLPKAFNAIRSSVLHVVEAGHRHHTHVAVLTDGQTGREFDQPDQTAVKRLVNELGGTHAAGKAATAGNPIWRAGGGVTRWAFASGKMVDEDVMRVIATATPTNRGTTTDHAGAKKLADAVRAGKQNCTTPTPPRRPETTGTSTTTSTSSSTPPPPPPPTPPPPPPPPSSTARTTAATTTTSSKPNCTRVCSNNCTQNLVFLFDRSTSITNYELGGRRNDFHYGRMDVVSCAVK